MAADSRKPKKLKRRTGPGGGAPEEGTPPSPATIAGAGRFERFLAVSDDRVDIASVAFFRICFGLLMVKHVLEYLVGGRLRRQFLEPTFHFKYEGFEWVTPGSPALLYAVFIGLAVAAAMIACGLFYRWAAALFFLGITYVFLLDTATFQNHLYLISLVSFLMIFVPAHRAFSLDARRRPALRSDTVPAWVLWLLRFQIAVPYFYGGLAKLNYDWLVRAQPMTVWMSEGTEGHWGMPSSAPWAPYVVSWGGVLFDLLIVPALLWRRTRIPALLLAVAFHLTNSQLFTIGIFPWLMIAATLLFLEPSWPRRAGFLGRRAKLRGALAGARGPTTPTTGALSRSGRALLALYVAAQLLVPFRHFLYPGYVDWTEEGSRFSWRMKLRDKRGEMTFVAVDPVARKIYPLDGLEAALTPTQRRMMIHDPEMMRQCAHWLQSKMHEAGYENVQVRVRTDISLNGRPKQPLIEPDLDLSSVPATFGSAKWIVPLRP
jgi:vitamin K-dependent gamma-carboxylase